MRTFKRKLKLTKSQESRILSWVGTCRLVYNLGLEVKIAAYKSAGKSVHKYALMAQLPELRKEYPWIEDVSCGVLQETIERLDHSFVNFFRTFKKGGGFPKFAKKGEFRSMKFKKVTVGENCVHLPKLGRLKLYKDSVISGTPKKAIIVCEPTGIFICLQCEGVPKKFDSENQAIGLDMGLSHFCIDSNGGFIKNPAHFKDYERKLRIENRSLARKVKGSKGWLKQAKKMRQIHHTIGNVRRDFLNKESTKIAKQNSVVYMEDLRIRSMTSNRKLAKHILDCGWGMFRIMLGYKTKVVGVEPMYTSQTCHECGSVDAKSRVSQSSFVCTSCGCMSNADVNAAKNIISKGIALDRKREPTGCALVL